MPDRIPRPPESGEPLSDLYFDLVRARTEAESRLQESSTLLEGLRRLNAALAPAEIHHALLEVIAPVFGFEDACILEQGGEGAAELFFPIAATAADFGESPWQGGDFFRRVLAGRPLALFDTARIPEWQSCPAVLRERAVSALHIPLHAPGLSALLVCIHRERGFFTNRHCRLAERFAVLAVQALRHAGLFAALQAEGAAMRRRIEMASFIGDTTSRFLDPPGKKLEQTILETLAGFAVLERVDRCFLFYGNATGGPLDKRLEWSVPGLPAGKYPEFPREAIPWWMDRLSQVRLIICHRTGELPDEALAQLGAFADPAGCSLLLHRLGDENAVFGFLGLETRRAARSWEAEDQRALETLANTYSQAIVRCRAREEIERHLAEKEILLREVHHRIKNNMATVGYFLFMQANSLSDPAGIAALQDAHSRVASMGALYDRLYRSPDFTIVDLHAYLGALVADISRVFPVDPDKIKVETAVESVEISTKISFPLGIIVNELLTNSYKYAFPGGRRGMIRVSATRGDAGQVILFLADDGIGLPQSVDPNQPQGFGLTLVEMLVRQIKGSFTVRRDAGTCWRIEFPQRVP